MAEAIEQKKEFWLLSQEESNYAPVSTVAGKACSSCRFFHAGYGDEADRCHIVSGWPEPIVPNGYCDRHEVAPVYEPEPMEVVIVGEASAEVNTGELNAKELDAFELAWKHLKRFVTNAFRPQAPGAFSIQKDLKGDWRWIATFTNNFQDRDKEIISEKALDDYLERVESGLVPMPELWVGHVKGTKHGQADMVFGVGNFLVATGTFDDTPEAKRAIKYYEKYAAKTPLSHGFTFPEWALKDGIYEVINTFEVSTLPPPLVASNPYTDLEIQSMKQVSDSQQAALALVLGKEFTEELVASRKQMSEDVKAAGVAYKDFVDPTPEQTEGETETTVDVKPIAQMIADLHEGMGELVGLLTASGKAYQTEAQKSASLETRLAAAEKTITELQSELKLKPRAASQASETKLTPEAAAAAKAEMPNDDDDFWK